MSATFTRRMARGKSWQQAPLDVDAWVCPEGHREAVPASLTRVPKSVICEFPMPGGFACRFSATLRKARAVAATF